MKIKIILTAESNTAEGIEILQAIKKQILTGELKRDFQDWKSYNIKVKTAFECIEK